MRLRWTRGRRMGGPVCWGASLSLTAWAELVDLDGSWYWEMGGVGRVESGYAPTRRSAARQALAAWRLHLELAEGEPADVRCWACGYEVRRVPYLVVEVIGRVRRVLSYGSCSDPSPWGCHGSLHTPADAAFVLRAALELERRGGNQRSEYDL